MNLETKIMQDIKEAMLAKDTLKLEVYRSIKSAILLAKTEKKSELLTQEKELEILQKLLKQRRESEKIYTTQLRLDLANHEKNQADIILKYLPTPYTKDQLEGIIDILIKELNISSKQEIGKLISAVMQKAKGRADGKSISQLVKEKIR